MIIRWSESHTQGKELRQQCTASQRPLTQDKQPASQPASQQPLTQDTRHESELQEGPHAKPAGLLVACGAEQAIKTGIRAAEWTRLVPTQGDLRLPTASQACLCCFCAANTASTQHPFPSKHPHMIPPSWLIAVKPTASQHVRAAASVQQTQRAQRPLRSKHPHVIPPTWLIAVKPIASQACTCSFAGHTASTQHPAHSKHPRVLHPIDC